MKSFYRLMLRALNSGVSVFAVIAYCAVSFLLGQAANDMNLFAASGAVMTIFGLFSMIRFTTIEKYLQQESIIANSTGITGPPLSSGEAAKITKENQDRARLRLRQELRSEIQGILLSVAGTVIWAYGVYVPVFASSGGT